MAELRALLVDCLTLWGVPGRVAVDDDNSITISATDGDIVLQPAAADMRPVRWFVQTPPRRAANRPPRALPSIVAALTTLRTALGAKGGNQIRIGAAGPMS